METRAVRRVRARGLQARASAVGRVPSRGARVCEISALGAAILLCLPGRAAPVFYQIDLSGCTTNRLEDHGPGDCWSVVPRGLKTLADVPFQMDRIVEVTGMGTLRAEKKFFPTRLTGIPAGHKADRIHVVHGVGYADPDGTPIGKILVQYRDGSEAPLYLIYGVNTRNWWIESSETKNVVDDPDTTIAWSYRESPWNLRLFKTAFANPHPDREIKSLAIYSFFSRSTPVIVAITLEENPAGAFANSKAQPSVDEAVYRRELRVKVLDAESKAAPLAVGRFTLTDTNNTFSFGEATADDLGVLHADYPASQVLEFVVQARAPGLLSRKLVLTNPVAGNLPAEQEVKLEPGMQVGGMIQDPAGKPIAGANVSVLAGVRDMVGQVLEEEADRATTAADGRWSSRSIPPEAKSLTFKLSHPEFRPAEYYLSEAAAPGPEEVAKSDLLAGKAVLQMKPGTRIEGKVVDTEGKGIPGAEILVREARDEPVDHRAKGGADGRFQITILRVGEGIIASAAPGFAPESADLSFDDDLKPLVLQMHKAKPLQGRVLTAGDDPVAGATVTLVSWKGLTFPNWETKTDAEGRFTWDAPPQEGALYAVRKTGFGTSTPQELAPGDQEATLRLVKNGLVTGTVVDAETQKPIASFRVIRGRVFSPGNISWERYRPTTGSDGKYSCESEENWPMSFRLLVEAPGYLPALSPTLRGQGWTNCNFALKPGHGPAGVLKLPDGQPAVGAQVALLTGDYTVLKERALEGRGGNATAQTQVETDKDGKFALAAAYAQQLVAVHREGFAEVHLETLSTNLELVLQPWGTIEGTVRNGRHPATNVWVMVAPRQTEEGFGMSLQYDFEQYRTQSDGQGHFVISNVPPGVRQLVRLYEDGRGWSWSHGEPVTVNPGGSTQIQFGGKGRTIVGKVVPSDPNRQISWQTGHHVLGTRQPRPPASFRTEEEYETWSNSAEVKEARARYRYYAVQFDPNGSFRVEDVPPGAYDLQLIFYEPGPNAGMGMGTPVGNLQESVGVPEMPNGLIDEPLDLGKLELAVRGGG